MCTYFLEFFRQTVKPCKTTKHFRNQLKSILLSEYNWLHFGACLVCVCVCVFFFCVCNLSICKVYYFASLLKPLLRAWFFSGLYAVLIMSSISCCVFLCLSVLLYDIGIKFDMMMIYDTFQIKRIAWPSRFALVVGVSGQLSGSGAGLALRARQREGHKLRLTQS